MKLRNRYFGIAFGFLVFLLLGPFLVSFVSGVKYDFSQNRYQPTGALLIKTDPRGAQIEINGETIETSPASLRYLQPGDYEITLTKKGYFSWTKQLRVDGGKVNNLAGNEEAIILLKKNNPSLIEKNVSNAFMFENKLALLIDGVVYLKPSHSEIRPTSAIGVTNIRPSNDGRYLYLSSTDTKSTQILDMASEEIISLGLIASADSQFIYFDKNFSLEISDQNLYEINLQSQEKKLLLPQIVSMTNHNNQIYYIQKQGEQSGIFTGTIINNRIENISNLITDISIRYDSVELFVTANRELLLLTNEGQNKSLYRVNNELQKISENVEQVFFNPNKETVVYSTAGSIWQYQFSSNQPYLITRLSQMVTSPTHLEKLGYIIFGQNQSLIALEIDNRDRQNQYELATGESLIKKILWQASHSHVYYLTENGELFTLQIR